VSSAEGLETIMTLIRTLAGARRFDADPVVRAQRVALAVAMMLSSSNVSPMTTILASLLFAALAGWARAHSWSRASSTYIRQAGAAALMFAPSAETALRDPLAGTHRATPVSSAPPSAAVQRPGGALRSAPDMSFRDALEQVT
jgi:hypothetical protein